MSALLLPLMKNVMIWLAQLVEAKALNVMEASYIGIIMCTSQFQLFRNVVHIQQSV